MKVCWQQMRASGWWQRAISSGSGLISRPWVSNGLVQCVMLSSKCSEMTFNSWSLAVALASDIAVMMMSRSSENRFERNLGRVPTEFFGNCTPRSTLFPFSFMSRALVQESELSSIYTQRMCGAFRDVFKKERNLLASKGSFIYKPSGEQFCDALESNSISSSFLWVGLSREWVTLEVYKFNILENPHNDSWQDVLRMY